MKKEIKTTKAPEAIGPYSQGIFTDGSSRLIFLSGQIPVNPADGTVPEGIEAQTKQVFENIKAILATKKGYLDDIVKTTVFMKNLDDFAAMNAVYAEQFKKPYPARSTVEVAALPKGVLIEIEVIALDINPALRG
ncbi:MAG: RidA family protein [Clostridiaceae bacterium]|nr:RidA family protein [Clostridiaceae bacterium]